VPSKPTIIPVAAGKGGVGKSFLAANLAIALAEKGHWTVLVDLDLGGSNVHSFLGLPNQSPGIGDFLKARRGELDDLLVSTPISNLRFLPGDGKTPFMANIPTAQKRKLISRIEKLPAEYVLLDLNAGSSFNTLDFFGLSPRGILLTTPERPAVMNMMVFLKNFILRAIERKLARNYSIRNMLHEVYKKPMEEQTLTIDALQRQIAAEDPIAGEAAAKVYKNCRPRVVFNMGNHPDELKVASQISDSLSNILSLDVDYFGYIFYDSSVRESVQKQVPYLTHFRSSPAAKNIVRIGERIVKYWDKSVEDSAGRLMHNVRKAFENRN